LKRQSLSSVKKDRIRGRKNIRPVVKGKFVFLSDEKLYVRGVTYGSFRPDENGNEYHNLDLIERDFAQMAANGMNAVRIPHTMPPRSLLDVAQRHGLYVMVGLSAEQYVGYIIDKKGAPNIEAIVREKVRSVAGHPALLCYAIGNEIPAPIVRWLGRRRVERYLRRIYRAIKAEDPEGLVTYVNYPTTEYLQLPFLDLVCFNVYLESQDRLKAYLAHLQNIAGDRPLIMSEIGLDSLRNGEDTQAHVLEWQIRMTFEEGCAGAFIFAWTDEWNRDGAQVDDWAFGLTDRNRNPKPALAAVQKAFAKVPFRPNSSWPRISVVVCTYNGNRTIRDCLEGLKKVKYPNFEVIVVDDGSTDETVAILNEYDFRRIRTKNNGLSNARNLGLKAATGEIIAYIDDDAYPDQNWLTYLAEAFLQSEYAGMGGPNVAPPGDGLIADCIDKAPGGPVHVLLSDREAEHIPGCNMAFRKEALEAIDGFDPKFRAAGDDVDVCWRLQQKGYKLGFSPAAMVWHHCRNSVRAYWKQQKGYGKAEALLESKWPEKYNSAGHISWAGQVYGNGWSHKLGLRGRIYHGIWGSAPFQSIYQPTDGQLRSLLLMPELYLIIAGLAVFSALGVLWTPLLLTLPLLAVATGTLLFQAGLNAKQVVFNHSPRSRLARFKMWSLTSFLYLLQPLARLLGRLRHGLTIWRRRGPDGLSLPFPRTSAIWTEEWQAPEERLRFIEAELRAQGAIIYRGGDFDRWDLEVQGGILGGARLLMAAEDHGAGTQFVRYRIWPRIRTKAFIGTLLFGSLSVGASLNQVWSVSVIFGLLSLFLVGRTLYESASSKGSFLHVLKRPKKAAK